MTDIQELHEQVKALRLELWCVEQDRDALRKLLEERAEETSERWRREIEELMKDVK